MTLPVSRYIWLMLVTTLLPITMALAWLLHSGWQAQENNLAQRMDGLAAQQQQLLDYRLENGARITKQIATAAWARQLSPSQCANSVLHNLLASTNGFSNITILDLNGKIICSALPLDALAQQRVNTLPILSDLLQQQQAAISEPFFAPLSRRWVSVLSRPIIDLQGKWGGQVLLSLDLAALPRLSPSPDLPTAIHWQVYSASKRLLQASSPALQIGRSQKDITTDRASEATPDAARAWETRLSMPEETEIQRKKNLRHANWQVIVSIPDWSVHASLLKQGSPLILGMLLAVTLAIISGGLLARALLRPIQHLTQFALRVGRGENALRASSGGPLELDLLGQELNRMLDTMEYAESRYRLLFGASTDGVIVVDRQMTILAVNEHGAAMFGYDVTELVGQSVNILVPHALRSAHQHIAQNYTGQPANRDMGHRPTLKGVRKNGSTILLQITLSPLPNGSAGSVAAIIKDVSEQHHLQEKVQWLSQYDPLTNLPNRILLTDRLDQAINRAQNQKLPLALLLIGLDHFKAINDSYGHDYGDHALSIFAQRLSEEMGSERTVARVGGDEFAILIEDAAAAHQLPGILERIRQVLQQPIEGKAAQKTVLGSSIGVALFPNDATDGRALMKAADRALMLAKQQNKGSVSFFSEELMPRYRRELEMESQLRAAIAENCLLPYFQPIVDCTTGQIAGVEALARWPHEKSMISPATFLPLAESAGLLPGLEQQIRSKAMTAIRQWSESGHKFWLAINISAGEFDNPHFAASLAVLVQETGLTPQQIVLEITEGAVLGNQETAVSRMQQLQSMGYRIAIDDFGTGYSSLSYLHAFPFDRLKLDRSFIARLLSDSRARKVTAAIIAMAHELGLLVIAEGIEEAGQLAMLQEMGCDYVQGFYLHRPQAREQITQLLEQTSPLQLAGH